MQKSKLKGQDLASEVELFEFSGYELAPENRQVSFHYLTLFADGRKEKYTERIILPNVRKQRAVPDELLAEVLKNVHLALGVSYYKLYAAERIKLKYALRPEQAEFWHRVYQKGLGEFYFTNNLDPKSFPGFPSSDGAVTRSAFELPENQRVLLGVGGGKDSIVAGELLKEAGEDLTGFTVSTQNTSPVTEGVVKQMKVPSLNIKRYLDDRLLGESGGSLQGHVPISSVYAWLGLLAAVLYGYRYVVVANEHSSNVGNLKYKGEIINHQWSKSEEFEHLLQTYVQKFLTPDVTYFSVLRSFFEIRIVKMFTKYQKYWPYFSSCNRNFAIQKDGEGKLWCGKCPKCAFVFATMSAFVGKDKLKKIFGKNLYEDTELIPVFEDLLGLGSQKPFDCVGTFEETRAAFHMAGKEYEEDLVIKKLLPKINGLSKAEKEVFKAWRAPGIPPRFRWLGMESALILGHGKEGKVTERYLKEKYDNIKISVADKEKDSKYLSRQNDVDIVVKTPGIPKDKVTRQYTTATNIFFSRVEQMTIGVTGTKGKSTTAALICAILKSAGKKAQLLGNIGQPMLGALLKKQHEDEIYVLELSSYQLDDVEASPHIAVALNLWPDHMDYHGSEQAYYRAKKNITRWQRSEDFFVFNPEDKRLAGWAEKTRAQAVPYVSVKDMPVVETALLGQHNVDNIRAAITVAGLAGVPQKAIKKALVDFKPLPHRLERIGEVKGIVFYDDAVSTTPQSTIQAIKTLANVGTIFLGGQDRGYDFSELEQVVREYNIENIVLFPDSGKKVFSSRAGLNILETSDMNQAVRFAFEHTKPGQVCLLSTASPSYSLWRDFEEQGNEFRAAIKQRMKKL